MSGWAVKFTREGNEINTDQMLPVGEWIQVAAMFDETTAKVYFNGVVVQEGSLSFGSETKPPFQISDATSSRGRNIRT